MKKTCSPRLLWTLMVITGIVSPLTGLAEEAKPVTSTVVVTATKVEKDLKEVPSSVSVVTEKEIQRHGYTNVADILQDVPGVEISDQSVAGAKRITIRGESGERTLILVDGQKISEQKSMNGAPLLINPSNIARIEVVKGPASVLYGSEAIGGVVNIITKKGGDKPIGGDASLTYNSSTHGFEESLALNGSINGYYYRLSGTYSDQSNRRTPSGTLNGSDYLVRDVNGVFGYEDEKIAFGANIEDYYSESDVPKILDYPATGGYFDLNLPEWSREKVGGFIDIKRVSEIIAKIHLDAYAQKTIKDFKQDMYMTMAGGSNLNIKTYNDQKTYSLNSQIDLTPNNDHYVIAGLSLNRDTLDATTDTAGTGIYTAYNYNYFYDASIETYALYIQDQWKLTNDVELTLGGRQTWIESRLKNTDDTTISTGSVRDDHPVFSAGITWKGMEGLILRGLLSQGYRFPDLNKLYIGTTHGGSSVTYANPNLQPETSNNIEIGARYDTKALSVDIALFASKAKDYITTEQISASVYQFTNVDRAKTYGIEATASYKIAPYNLTPYASATFMRRKYEESDSSTWNTNTPALSGRLGMKYEQGINGGTFWTDLYLRAATDADDASSGTLVTNAAWQTLNLGVGANFGPKDQYKVSLNINNMLDQSYRTAQNSLDEAGRHFVARLSAAF